MSADAPENLPTSSIPSTSTDTVSDAKKKEITIQAYNLLAQGKRNLLCQEIPTAVDQLQEASKLLATTFGETAKECAEAYLTYGRALLELARMENGVLGNALQGVPPEEEGDLSADEQFEKTDTIKEEERLELRKEVCEALSIIDEEKATGDGEKTEKSDEKKEADDEQKDKIDGSCVSKAAGKGDGEKSDAKIVETKEESKDKKTDDAKIDEKDMKEKSDEKIVGKNDESKDKKTNDAKIDEKDKKEVSAEKVENKDEKLDADKKESAKKDNKDEQSDKNEDKKKSVVKKDESKKDEVGKDAVKDQKVEKDKKEKSEDGSEKDDSKKEKIKEDKTDKDHSEKMETEETVTKTGETAQKTDDDETKSDKSKKDDTAKTGDEADDENGTEDGTEDDGEEESMDDEEGEDTAVGDDTTAEGETDNPDDISNFQLSWEILELAKFIYSKETEEKLKLKASEACMMLGEISLETEQYEKAIEDITKCLDIQKEHLEPENRLIAETHYQLGLAYLFNTQHREALKHLETAVAGIKTKIEKLKTVTDNKGIDEKDMDNPVLKAKNEIKELEEILPEICTKMEDVKEEMKNFESVKAMAKEAFSNAVDSVPQLKSSDKKEDTSAGKVNDIGHLMRKKRKPEEDEAPSDDKDAKKSKSDPANQSNGEIAKVTQNGDIKMNGVACDGKVTGEDKENSVTTTNGHATPDGGKGDEKKVDEKKIGVKTVEDVKAAKEAADNKMETNEAEPQSTA